MGVSAGKLSLVSCQTYVKIIKRRNCELKNVITSRISSSHPSLQKEEPGKRKSVFEIIYGIDIPQSFKFDIRVLSQLASDPGELISAALFKLVNSSDFVSIDFICNSSNIKYVLLVIYSRQSSSLKGTIVLPNIVDPNVKIAVLAKVFLPLFIQDDLALAAKAAGAENVGAEELAELVHPLTQ